MPCVFIVGYVRHILGRGGLFGSPIHDQSRKKVPSSIGLKSYKAFQTTLRKWARLNFDLNFSFKFFYNFTGQLEKLPKSNF